MLDTTKKVEEWVVVETPTTEERIAELEKQVTTLTETCSTIKEMGDKIFETYQKGVEENMLLHSRTRDLELSLSQLWERVSRVLPSRVAGYDYGNGYTPMSGQCTPSRFGQFTGGTFTNEAFGTNSYTVSADTGTNPSSDTVRYRPTGTPWSSIKDWLTP